MDYAGEDNENWIVVWFTMLAIQHKLTLTMDGYENDISVEWFSY